MRAGNQRLLHDVVAHGFEADNAFSPALLNFVGFGINALDVAGIGQSDCHFFVGNQIGFGNFADLVSINFHAPLIAIGFFGFRQFFFDHRLDLGRTFQYPEIFGNLGHQFLQFIVNLLPFQFRQRRQLGFQNRVGLDLVKLESLHQIVARVFAVLGFSDDADHFVNIGQTFHQPFQNMRPLFGTVKFKLDAARHHLLAMLQKIVQRFGKV